jgi:mRNA-degrading endonuclease RelE of RelBE toxin-antitoxin system
MEFFEAPIFTQFQREYLDDDEYRKLQQLLGVNPELGDLMPGTGGFRKLRWADPRRGKGRRGGLRVIYYYFTAEHQIWLMTVYGKDEADDLTPKEKKALGTAITAELKQREQRRSRKNRR